MNCERIPREVRSPLLVNMLTGGVTPILPVDELGKLGYKIVVCPIESLLVAGSAVLRLIDALLTTGRVDQTPDMLGFDGVKKLLGHGAAPGAAPALGSSDALRSGRSRFLLVVFRLLKFGYQLSQGIVPCRLLFPATRARVVFQNRLCAHS